jgi:hypothetical protein
MISGFLLRSFVVKGWPDLQVDGYSKVSDKEEDMDASKLKILRMETLSPNLLLCLFEGDLKTADIHQKPEGLHLGFDIYKDASLPPPNPPLPPVYFKKLRNAEGKELEKKEELDKATIWLDEKTDKHIWDIETRVVNIGKLFEEIKNIKTLNFNGPFSSAQFALSLVEGVQKIRFVRGDASAG